MLRKLYPENFVQELAYAAGALGMASCVVMLIDYNAGMYPSGIGFGLWLAAVWSDMRGV